MLSYRSMNVPCIGRGEGANPGLAAAVRKLPLRLEYSLSASVLEEVDRNAGWTEGTDGGGRKVKSSSSLHSSGSLYINLGFEKRFFSLRSMMRAIMRAMRSGKPTPTAAPINAPIETMPLVSADASAEGVDDTPGSDPTRDAICAGRRERLVSAGRVKVSALQSAERPQANVLLSVSVEQGVIAISAFSPTATMLC